MGSTIPVRERRCFLNRPVVGNDSAQVLLKGRIRSAAGFAPPKFRPVLAYLGLRSGIGSYVTVSLQRCADTSHHATSTCTVSKLRQHNLNLRLCLFASFGNFYNSSGLLGKSFQQGESTFSASKPLFEKDLGALPRVFLEILTIWPRISTTDNR